MGVTCWYWIRHAALAVAAHGRIHGASEAAVDMPSPAVLAGMRRLLPPQAMVIASPLARARDTAAALLPDRPALIEPAFTEQNFGAWEGRVHGEIETAEPEAYAAFWRQPARACPPGGERYTEVMARVAAAVDARSRDAPGAAAPGFVVVAHAGVIRAALSQALGLTPEQSIAFVVDPLSLTRIDRIVMADGAVLWRVVCVNRPLAAPAGDEQGARA